MTDDDRPIAYTALASGTPVVTAAGRTFGRVERVLADTPEDIFHGLVVATSKGKRFVTRTQVVRITTRQVLTSLDDAGLESLPLATRAQLSGERQTVYAQTGVGPSRAPFVVIARCARGGLFETLWVPGLSLRAFRLGPYRIMRCPVHRRVEVVRIVDPSTLTRQERAAAAAYPPDRLP